MNDYFSDFAGPSLNEIKTDLSKHFKTNNCEISLSEDELFTVIQKVVNDYGEHKIGSQTNYKVVVRGELIMKIKTYLENCG